MNIELILRRHGHQDWALRWIGYPAICAIALAAGTSAVDAADTQQPMSVEQLVSEALRAEAVGDAVRRETLLDEAVQSDPDFALAHWQRGEIAVDDGWLKIDDAQQSAANDPQRVEYLVLRKRFGDSATGQLGLARWCRKHGLEDEARFHWSNVLTRNPDNEEALRALGVRWYNNQLLSGDEIASVRKRARESHRAAKRWAPQVDTWERWLSAGDILSRDRALGEIRGLQDADAIPALEEVTLNQNLTTNARFERSMQVGLALVEALDAMPAHAATKSLLRHAAFSQVKSVRNAAIAALKNRSMHDYVPLLLSQLAMPLESSFRVVTDTDGSVHYWHSLYREGRYADWSYSGRYSAMQIDLQGPTEVTIDDRIRDEVTEMRFGASNNPAVRAEMAQVASRNQGRFGAAATSAEQQVARMNDQIKSANEHVVSLLSATTGEQLGSSPRAWWDWWENYNEYYSDGEAPVYSYVYGDSEHRYYRPPTERKYVIPEPNRYPMSCFAKGTPVWTKTGLRAIETLEIGDLVLAQDVNSGELAYKPIMGRTVRPPTEILKFSVDGTELRTTRGHPMWVAGIGWRMAKQLEEGAILHGVDKPLRVNAIESAGKAEAYNLIVAEFSDYFVGKSGILVHDNTPRQPTTATVPGLVSN